MSVKFVEIKNSQSEMCKQVHCRNAKQMTYYPISEVVFGKFNFTDALKLPYRIFPSLPALVDQESKGALTWVLMQTCQAILVSWGI